MIVKDAIVGGVVAAAVGMMGLQAGAREPVTASAPQTVAVKKSHAKPHPSKKEDTDPLAVVPVFSASAVGWQLIEDPATGVRLGVPEKLVPHRGSSRTGSRWFSTQGQIQVETFRLAEAALPALFEEEKKTAHRQIASSSLKPDGFAIAGVQGLKNFVVRADARGGEVRGMTILYDQATEGTMANVAVAMANAFVGFPDPNAAPPPGLRRAVEYGSAVVVRADGYLIAPLHVADDCRAVSVAGLGHAERIAADNGSGLALLRLYGARNLAAVSLADDAMQSGDLTLVGVADPLMPESSGEAASVAARLTAQGVEPLPRPGFAGAGAFDGRGRLVGVLDFKAPVVAGGAPAPPSAILVPADAIRGFLQAQQVAPAGGNGSPPAQSVFRVICVRK